MYRLTFNSPIVPDGSQININFDNSVFTSNINAHCRVGTNFVKSSAITSVLRCYNTLSGFVITGFETMTASTNV